MPSAFAFCFEMSKAIHRDGSHQLLMPCAGQGLFLLFRSWSASGGARGADAAPLDSGARRAWTREGRAQRHERPPPFHCTVWREPRPSIHPNNPGTQTRAATPAITRNSVARGLCIHFAAARPASAMVSEGEVNAMPKRWWPRMRKQGMAPEEWSSLRSQFVTSKGRGDTAAPARTTAATPDTTPAPPRPTAAHARHHPRACPRRRRTGPTPPPRRPAPLPQHPPHPRIVIPAQAGIQEYWLVLVPCTLPGGEGCLWSLPLSGLCQAGRREQRYAVRQGTGRSGMPAAQDPSPPGRETGNKNRNDAGFPPPRE